MQGLQPEQVTEQLHVALIVTEQLHVDVGLVLRQTHCEALHLTGSPSTHTTFWIKTIFNKLVGLD